MPSTGNLMNFLSLLAHLLPKNILSWVVGAVVRLRFPAPVSTWLVKGFASAFKIDLSEAECPIESYECIEDLFTRRLKTGARTVTGPVASPADGFLARSAPATDGTAVQAKGLDYPLVDLVYGSAAVPTPTPDYIWYQTIYLAPHNYHRVHTPFSGRVTAVRYLPGDLWPVNLPFVLRIPRLFCRNERLVFDFELESGGKAAVVMVGALNVGRMVTPLVPELITNTVSRLGGASPATHRFPEPIHLTVGDEIGTFMLGSTVIIAYERGALDGIQLVQGGENKPILMGQSLTSRGAP